MKLGDIRVGERYRVRFTKEQVQGALIPTLVEDDDSYATRLDDQANRVLRAFGGAPSRGGNAVAPVVEVGIPIGKRNRRAGVAVELFWQEEWPWRGAIENHLDGTFTEWVGIRYQESGLPARQPAMRDRHLTLLVESRQVLISWEDWQQGVLP